MHSNEILGGRNKRVEKLEPHEFGHKSYTRPKIKKIKKKELLDMCRTCFLFVVAQWAKIRKMRNIWKVPIYCVCLKS